MPGLTQPLGPNDPPAHLKGVALLAWHLKRFREEKDRREQEEALVA